MSMQITLASTSRIRQHLLRSANVDFEVQDSAVDEGPLKRRLIAQEVPPHQIALELAAAKAEAVAAKINGLVLGCDQVLAFEDRLLSKPDSFEDARQQLLSLRGRDHMLLSAAVLYDNGARAWSHVGQVTLTMRHISDAYLEGYLNRNWPGIQSSVGGYKLEEEGIRLFSKVEGDYFTVLGMPLVEILGYLGQRGAIET